MRANTFPDLEKGGLFLYGTIAKGKNIETVLYCFVYVYQLVRKFAKSKNNVNVLYHKYELFYVL